MGEEADSILYSFGLSDDDRRKKYNTVSNKSEVHFVKQRNHIYECRKKFNMLRHEEGELVDSFITSLYRLTARQQNIATIVIYTMR